MAATALLALAFGTGIPAPGAAQGSGMPEAGPDPAPDPALDTAPVSDRILAVGSSFDIPLPRPRRRQGDAVASPMPAAGFVDFWRLGRYLPGGAVVLDRRVDARDHQLGFDSGAGLDTLFSTEPLRHLFPGYYAAIEKPVLEKRGPRRIHFGLRYPAGLVSLTPRPPNDGDRYRWRWGDRPALFALAVDPYLAGATGLRLDLYQRQDDDSLDPLASTELSGTGLPGARDPEMWLARHLVRSGRYRLAAHLYRRDDRFSPIELAGFDFELALEAPPPDPEAQAPRPAPGDIVLSRLSDGPVSAYAPVVEFRAEIPPALRPAPDAPPLDGEIRTGRLFPDHPLPPGITPAGNGAPAPKVPGLELPALKVPGVSIPTFEVPQFELPAPGAQNTAGPVGSAGPAGRTGPAGSTGSDRGRHRAGRYYVRLVRLPFDSYFCMRLGPFEVGERGAVPGHHAADASLPAPWHKVDGNDRISIPVPRHPGRYRLKLYRLDHADGRSFAVYANAHADFEVAVPWQAGRLTLGPRAVRQAPDEAPPPGGFGIAVQASLPPQAGKGWSAALYRPPSRLDDGEDLPRHFAGTASLDPDDPRAFLAEDLHTGRWEVLLRDPLNRVVDRARFQVAGLDPVLRIDGKLQRSGDGEPVRVTRMQAPDPDWPRRNDPRRGLAAWRKAPFTCRDPVFRTPPVLRVVRLDAGAWRDPDDDRYVPVDAVVPGHPYFIEAEFDTAPAAQAYPLRIDGRRMTQLRQTREPRIFRTDSPVALVPPRQDGVR